MPFIAQGKTNIKYLLIVVVVAAIFGSGIIYLQNNFIEDIEESTPTETEEPDTSLSEMSLSYSVKGCAETDKGVATKSYGTEKEPKIEIVENKIIYSRAINNQCCRKAVIEKETKDNIINIYEVWSGVGCKCICFSEIEATIDNIPKGHYVVNVYEKGIKPGDNNEPMDQKLIATKEIDILQTVEPQLRDVKLYYYNPNLDKDSSGNILCSRKGLVAVDRKIPITNTPIQDTIKLLISGGLTSAEKEQGVATEYPLQGLSLTAASLNTGVLTLTFDDLYSKTGGGSCRVGILWFQIEATAKQFSGVSSVRFMPEELFQP